MTIQVGVSTQAAKTSTYPVICRFPLFVELCDHNPPTLKTDRHHDRGVKAAFYDTDIDTEDPREDVGVGVAVGVV